MKASRMTLALVWLLFLATGGIGCTDDDIDALPPDFIGEGEGEVVATVFSARMSGTRVKPIPATTTMIGTIEINLDGEELTFSLIMEGGNDITSAHIHLASVEQTGPIVVELFGPVSPMDLDGELAAGVITSAQLTGPLAGGESSDLVENMRSGTTYVDVHTQQFPEGAVRGQVVPGDLEDGIIVID